MAIKFNGTFTVVDDTPNPDLKIAPTSTVAFNFSVETGTQLKARLVEVLEPMIAAEEAHLASLQIALAQAQS